jgi:lipoprotein-releasing system permease protein
VRSSPETAQELSKVLPKNVSVKTWYDLHKQLLTVMTIERWVAYILLLLIIIVAVFNILASQTMSVIEKKRDIGILQTMGIERISIKRIFLYQGIISGLAGTLIGFLLGAFVYWLQQEFNIYPLDPTVFKISSLPMKMEFIDFVVVGFASIGLSILAAFIPARRASKIDPLEAIRWE